jgi:phasin family protein
MVESIKKVGAKRAVRRPAAPPKASRATGPGSAPARGALKAPALATLLVDARRKDLNALSTASKKSLQGLQAVVQRQTKALEAAISEWQAVTKVMGAAGARESIANLDQLGRGVFAMALDNIREIAKLAADTQAEALDVVKQRIGEDVEEAKQLLRRE